MTDFFSSRKLIILLMIVHYYGNAADDTFDFEGIDVASILKEHAAEQVGNFLLKARTDRKNPSTVISAKIDRNTITYVELNDSSYSVIFEQAPRLQRLSIHHHKFVNPAPTYAEHLVFLDLSHGTLVQFPLFAHLDKMRALRELDLSHNQLTTLAYNDDATVKYSKMESVAPEKRTIYTLWEHKLKKLNVSHNVLSVLNMYMLGQLTDLKEADFSHNQIQAIVTVPEPCIKDCLRYWQRSVTKVLLAGNSLSQTNKDTLNECQYDLAPAYKKSLDNYSCRGCIGGLILAPVATIGGVMIFCFTTSVPYSGYMYTMVGGILGGLAGGAALYTTAGCLIGRGIARCRMPQAYKKAPIFEFLYDDATHSVITLEKSENPDGEEDEPYV